MRKTTHKPLQRKSRTPLVNNNVDASPSTNEMNADDFGLPGSRRYPISTEAHALSAVQNVDRFGTSDERETVRNAVSAKFPDLELPAVTIADSLQAVHNSVKVTTRQETLEGRTYTVVPMVMLTEGVHAGSNGPLYYPSTELAKTPAVWNHKPIVVYHPTMNGTAISACEPAVINRRKVGLIMNTKWEPGKKGQPGRLKAEAWLEAGRLKAVDQRVTNAIAKGSMVEVSTGLFTDNEQTAGTWNKEQYDSVARNYRPDHLAILPDEKGACSIADGAGLLRNVEISFGDIRDKLSDLVRAKQPKSILSPGGGNYPPYTYVRDVYKKFCIYSTEDGKGASRLYKHEYKLDKDGVSLVGSPEQVTSRQTYMTADGSVVNTGESMNKKQAVNALIANTTTSYDEEDRDWLMGLELNQLEKMLPATNGKNTGGSDHSGDGRDDDNGDTLKDGASQVKPKKLGSKSGATRNVDADDEDDKKKGKATRNAEAAIPATVEEYIGNAPAGMRDVLQSMAVNHDAAKNRLIGTITANKANKFSKEYLQGMNLGDLQNLAALATPPDAPRQQALYSGNYAGQGDVVDNAQQTAVVEVALPVPTMNFARTKKETVTA